MKKLLALLLSALLVFGLSAPAAAVSRDDITITGPEEPVPYGESFTLRASVNLPDGVEVASYQWRYFSNSDHRIDGATDAALRVALGDASYPEASAPYWPAMRNYGCDVTFAEKDTDGSVINTFTLSSRDVRVNIARERKMNFGEILKESFETGLGFVAMTSVLSGYLLLPFFPVTFLIGFFLCFFDLIFK